MLLYRLVTPVRLVDMMPVFDNDLARYLYELGAKQAIDETVGYGPDIHWWNSLPNRKAPRRYCSDHRGYHGIKFQSIVTPDGLSSSLEMGQ